jgi:hypothetical protein
MMNSIRRRIEGLEARFASEDDRRLLASLCRAIQGDQEARAALERMCAVRRGSQGMVNVAEVFLAGPVEAAGQGPAAEAEPNA